MGQAKLGVYSLTTGERIAMVDLAAVIGTPNDPPQYFANDLTVDGSGTVYVTDTMNNVVFKVTPDYQASVLHRFTGLPQGVAGQRHRVSRRRLSARRRERAHL